MDPFSALSLASNVVQFVDFGTKLISASLELYNSQDGASSANSELETITEDLTSICMDLAQPERHLDSTLASGPERALLPIAQNCRVLGEEFLAVLQLLKAKGRHKKWESVRQAIGNAWKEKEIRKYLERLNGYRSEIALHLIRILSGQQNKLLRGQMESRAHQSRVAEALDNLAASHRRLELMVESQPAKIRTEIITSVQQVLIDTNKKTKEEEEKEKADLRSMSEEKRKKKKAQDERKKIEKKLRVEKVMSGLASKLSALASEGGTLAKELQIVETLCFPTILERQLRIAEAHAETCEWVFEENESRDHEMVLQTSLLDWLRTHDGKSTFMKYLHRHEKTLAALRTWAGEKRLVTASYFFWYAGGDMQKSQQGLLQTLLYDTLRQYPALVPIVCSSHWEGSAQKKNSWTRTELLDALKMLGKQNIDSIRFCFFIDGLDEYKGDHIEIIDIMNSFTSTGGTKICFSSRPWNVFEMAYGENSGSKLQLQGLTGRDIKRFVTDKLTEDRKFQELKATDNRYNALVREIVDRAQGVFLWVVLVVQSLRRGLTNSDTISELQSRLRIIPTELQEYFKVILDSVERIYHQQAARLYLMCFSAPGVLTAMSVSYFDEEDPNFALGAEIKAWSLKQAHERCDRTRTRVLARCTDLLECSADFHVNFLHRTVFDFLETQEIQELLIERAVSFDPDLYFCNAMLSQVKILGLRPTSTYREFTVLVDKFMCHAYRMEIRSHYTYLDLLDEMERTTAVLRHDDVTRWDDTWGPANMAAGYPDGWLIPMSIKWHLFHYLIRESHQLSTLNKKRCCNGRPPLDIALRDSVVNPQIIRLLLDHGANPNQKHELATVWALYWKEMSENKPLSQEGSEQEHQAPRMQKRAQVETLEMLILHGVDPTIDDEQFREVVSRFAKSHDIEHLEALRLRSQTQKAQHRIFGFGRWLKWR